MGTVAKWLLALALALVSLGLVAYVLRDAIATRVLAVAVDGREGLSCTHPNVDIDASLQRITVSSVRCEVAEGPVARVAAEGPIRVALDGITPVRAELSRATVDQRQRDVSQVESNTLGDLANLAGVRDMLAKGLLDSSEMFSEGGPVVRCDRLTAKRAGKLEATMHGFKREFSHGWDHMYAYRVDAGAGDLAAIRNFNMRVTPRRGVLTLDVFMGEPSEGGSEGQEPDLSLRVEGTDLDGKRPHLELSM